MKKYFTNKSMLYIFAVISLGLIISCSDDDGTKPNDDPLGPETPGFYGETTSAVFVINPIINVGSSTTVTPGTDRNGIRIMINGVDTVHTDSSGLAVMRNLPVGINNILVGNNNDTVYLDVVNEKDMYDLVLSYKPETTEYICPAVRYPYDSTSFTFVDSSNFAVTDFNIDSHVYIFAEGEYDFPDPNPYQITAEGALFFGAWDETTGSQTIFEDSIEVRGGNTRMRGIDVTEHIKVMANGFSAAFCSFGSADITGNGISLIRNIFTAGQATVPSSNAILVDNKNIP
ncbi:MAG TPA: hypothetical protein PLK90_09000 [Clostridiales bacterium]|nr:hypothetical protein [Clostridiales bacterium]